MTPIIKPQNVIDTENEKQLIQSGFSDYCTKLCPERYKKVTGERQCFCSFQGIVTNKLDYDLPVEKKLHIICTIENSNESGGFEAVGRLIDIKELRQIYEKE